MIPRILSSKGITRYRQAFCTQDTGSWHTKSACITRIIQWNIIRYRIYGSFFLSRYGQPKYSEQCKRTHVMHLQDVILFEKSATNWCETCTDITMLYICPFRALVQWLKLTSWKELSVLNVAWNPVHFIYLRWCCWWEQISHSCLENY